MGCLRISHSYREVLTRGCSGAAGLPLPNKHEALLAEMLFAQMLCVPQPPLKPLAYSTLMVRPLHCNACVVLLRCCQDALLQKYFQAQWGSERLQCSCVLDICRAVWL